MIRIRNPWGNDAEWKGAWSDGSPEWQYIPDDEKESLGINFDADGEFWMSYKDFKNYFDQVEICNLTPDGLDEDFGSRPKWEVATFQGSWIAGQTAGGCRNYLDTFASNPQYRLTVADPDEDDDDELCTVIVSLMQKGRRALRDEGLDTLTVGFALYYLKDPDSVPNPLDTDFFKYTRSAGRSKVRRLVKNTVYVYSFSSIKRYSSHCFCDCCCCCCCCCCYCFVVVAANAVVGIVAVVAID